MSAKWPPHEPGYSEQAGVGMDSSIPGSFRRTATNFQDFRQPWKTRYGMLHALLSCTICDACPRGLESATAAFCRGRVPWSVAALRVNRPRARQRPRNVALVGSDAAGASTRDAALRRRPLSAAERKRRRRARGVLSVADGNAGTG